MFFSMYDTTPSLFDNVFDVVEPREHNPYVIIRRYPSEAGCKKQQQRKGCPCRRASCKCRHNQQKAGAKPAEDFTLKMDVQDFRPEEITVKMVDDRVITVEGKHEEKADEHGFVYRHIVRKFTIPEGFAINEVSTKLSSDGQLCISAPRIVQAVEEKKERVIPITMEPAPTTGIEEKSKEAVTKPMEE